MGIVMSAIGFGGFFGQFVAVGISDIWGGRITATLSLFCVSVLLIAFISTGAHPLRLFVLLFLTTFSYFSLLALLTGPVATKAVNVSLISSAIGIVSGTGDIFGGCVAPSLAGSIAKRSSSKSTCSTLRR